MPYRNVEFTQGQYYHIYNRGAGRSKIFFVEENYKYLTRLVERNFKKYGIIIIAYCFMPNHYHFLLRECFLSLKHRSFVHGFHGTHGKGNFLRLFSVKISEIRGVRVQKRS